MKPTPSKVVLLMSAAGLGLSWSGAAFAARDSYAPASVAPTFGVSPKVEQGCDAQSADARLLCPVAYGELVRTIAPEAAALPLPLLLSRMGQAGGAGPSSPAVAAEVPQTTRHLDETGAVGGEPTPNDQAPLPDSPIAARGVDDSSREPEAGATATVLLDGPPRVANDAVAADAGPAQAPTAAAVGDPFVVVRDEPDPAVDAESVDRVFAALAQIVGADLDAAVPDIEAPQPRRAVAPVEASAQISVAIAEPAPMQAAELEVIAAPDPVPADRKSLQRSSEADEIVVAPSHADKVLMSLAALRSVESPEPAVAKKTVVVSHTDKVLEALALFQPKKTRRVAMACTAASDEQAGLGTRWEFAEAAYESAVASIGLEPDILLDLQLPVAERGEPKVLQVVPAQPSPSAPPVALRPEPSAIGGDLVALSADRLDEVRGGFVTEGGLKISFGIERAVYLNGTLVTTTSLNIADLSRISGGQAQISGDGSASALAVLQSGTGNVFAPGSISSTAAGTVIQNTLDNQKINTITRIDAVVNSSGIMRSMNLQSSMQSAIVNSLRR